VHYITVVLEYAHKPKYHKSSYAENCGFILDDILTTDKCFLSLHIGHEELEMVALCFNHRKVCQENMT